MEDDGRGTNIPGPLTDTGSVLGLWHGPGGRVACFSPTDTTWRWRRISVGDLLPPLKENCRHVIFLYWVLQDHRTSLSRGVREGWRQGRISACTPYTITLGTLWSSWRKATPPPTVTPIGYSGTMGVLETPPQHQFCGAHFSINLSLNIPLHLAPFKKFTGLT